MKETKQRYIKNGVFSLEYDKETLRDMIIELQQEKEDYKTRNEKAIKFIEQYNDKGQLESMFLDECYLSNYGASELRDILNGKSDE